MQALILDVTEQPIERPKYNQRAYYSGKKRCHTLKTEIRIDPDDIIWDVSKCYGGRTHDYKLHKKGSTLPSSVRIYADSGYQGLRKIRRSAATPYKRRRRKPLTKWQKLY